jgi:hypothetical protein
MNKTSRFMGICGNCNLIFEVGIGSNYRDRGIVWCGQYDVETDGGRMEGPWCDLHRGECPDDNVFLVTMTDEHWIFDLTWHQKGEILANERHPRDYRHGPTGPNMLRNMKDNERVDSVTVDLIGNLWRLTVGERVFHARTEELNDWMTVQRRATNEHLWSEDGPGYDDGILACFATRYRALMAEA